jgi:hypothetical protein
MVSNVTNGLKHSDKQFPFLATVCTGNASKDSLFRAVNQDFTEYALYQQQKLFLRKGRD